MKEIKIDERTRQYIERWGRSEVPTAQVHKGKINPGTYRGLIVLGWIERMSNLVPVCGLHFLILQNQAFTPMGSLSLALPVTKRTELHVNSFLHLLGWDGRVWPHDGDGGWPETSPENRDQIQELLHQSRNRVGSTLTFPVHEERGARIIELPIVKSNAPYPFAPFEALPEDAPSPAVHLERFRELCRDPSAFLPTN